MKNDAFKSNYSSTEKISLQSSKVLPLGFPISISSLLCRLSIFGIPIGFLTIFSVQR